jgi:mannose-1-phosphate guanylyltransferase
MDAIVLVGGQGVRLRPLTRTRHKSLIPMANRPAIEYLFEWLRRSGFDRVVLALGQHNDDLARAYPSGVHHGMAFLVIEESTRLESGGAIRNAVQTAGIEGRFAVLNGDIFIDFDFAAALATHEARGADLTLALHEVDDPSQYGVAVVNAEDMVTGFVEKPPPGTAPGNLINAGVWIFEPHLVDQIPPGAVRVEETLFPSLVGRGRPVYGHRAPGEWADLGTSARYLAMNGVLMKAQGTSALGKGVRLGTGATVSESAVGDGTVLGDHSTVRSSILWERVNVASGVEINDSIIADGVTIGANARLDRVVIGARATIAAGVHARPGTIVEPDAQYDGKDDE